ncbi:hypothetical protein CLV92_103316 [Kineococcus xinjiangensis]|uniref:Lysylphosphatidylglycerol synthase-like protein n=1 Tax=Kineococcus xinjiangensis TaxID=512762 RepID=A0A2S6IUD6_9ACTN|nr:lysylphosphatidylglycerol synthase domain-containing protein [Kineococcus xinjiangensis]PPK97781.1 hypothetical protein CLV92_103316 [Kineococcus xinjiangensis]
MLQRLLRLTRSRGVRGGFLVLALGFAVAAVLSERAAVSAALARLDAGAALLALLLSAANVALTGAAWRAVVADLGSPLPWRPAARVFLVGQLGRYVPGTVWQFLAQAELGRDHGVPRRRTASALGVSLLVSMTTAALLVVAVLPLALGWGAGGFAWTRWLPWAVPVLALLLVPRVLNPLLGLLLRAARQPPLEQGLSARGLLAAAGWSLASWLAVGGQVFVLVSSVAAAVAAAGPSAGTGAHLLALSVGGYALAWVVGFLVLIAPAGAGAREAALVAVLTAGAAGALGGGGALVVALLSRVLLTVADLLLAGAALLGARGNAVEERAVPGE